MDMESLKNIKTILRKKDTDNFIKAAKMICGLTGNQARFALLLISQRERGYLAMPDNQENFINVLKRAKKARE